MTGLGRIDPPAKVQANTKCPRCQATADKRVCSSMGRLEPDLCGVCGHEFKESA
jgi:hypothetical protein